MRWMGLDLGEKTIGIAVSDPFGWTAQAVEVIRRQSFEKDVSRIEELTRIYEVEEYVLGLPLNMNGSFGPKAQYCKEFSERLKDRTHCNVHLVDERLTTAAAQRMMIEADVSRVKRKKKIDQVAAALILQTFLDARPKG